jgi:hypothetical protein
VASLLEGSTLLALVLVAVPLKHLAGMPQATRIMGPMGVRELNATRARIVGDMITFEATKIVASN